MEDSRAQILGRGLGDLGVEGRKAYLGPVLSVESEGHLCAPFRMPSVHFSIPGEMPGRCTGTQARSVHPTSRPQWSYSKSPSGLLWVSQQGLRWACHPHVSTGKHLWQSGGLRRCAIPLVNCRWKGLSVKLFLGVPAPQHSGS